MEPGTGRWLVDKAKVSPVGCSVYVERVFLSESVSAGHSESQIAPTWLVTDTN